MSDTYDMPEPPLAPVHYTDKLEQPPEDEAETNGKLVETMRGISETTFGHYGHAVRSVHAKALGLVEGELIVEAGLPEVLAQGLFASPGTYPVAIRFSTSPGDLIDDSISSPRGMAIKVGNVTGERITGDGGGNTQDFVLIDSPSFIAATPKQFLGSLKLLAATTDRAEGAKKVLAGTLQGVEALLEAFGGGSATLKALGGHPITHPLGETFYSQTPIRYGKYIAKFAVAPVSSGLLELTNMHLNIVGDPDGLRGAVAHFFNNNSAAWELRVQLCTDLEEMPIEDASVEWDQEESPYVTVARITVKPQAAWSIERENHIDDELAFSPWHGLAAHRPLGGINRARKGAYEMSAGFRSEHNGCPIHPHYTGSRT